MAWLKLSGSTLPFAARFPIAVDASALGASTDKDVTVTIPKTLELFWALIQSSGDDIRITDADGITLVDYDWASFTYASRTGRWRYTARAGRTPGRRKRPVSICSGSTSGMQTPQTHPSPRPQRPRCPAT